MSHCNLIHEGFTIKLYVLLGFLKIIVLFPLTFIGLLFKVFLGGHLRIEVVINKKLSS